MTPKVFERTYLALKREVTSGRYKPGQRLQARSLADVLNASTSPVTNAMRQLVGERVLEYTGEDGFIIPWVNEQRLRDLFRWSAWLAVASPEEIDGAGVQLQADDLTPDDDIVVATERVFLALVGQVQNAELIRQVDNANDRLRAVRTLENRLISDQRDEIAGLERLRHEGNKPALRRAVSRYCRRRLDIVPQLVGLSYQDRH